MRLGHLHLPGITAYSVASAIQTRLVNVLLQSKTPSQPSSPDNPPSTALSQKIPGTTNTSILPDPIILTAEFSPVYTCGRREIGHVSAAQQAFLRASGAEFVEAQRGGQTTFHGPGQLVAYPILDLKRHFSARTSTDGGDAALRNPPHPEADSTNTLTPFKGLTVRGYVWLLEQCLINTLARFDVQGAHRDDRYPGVWTGPNTKIASVGVHLRRHVTSHGVGLNVHTDLAWFDHIVACGIDGVEMTSLVKELEQRGKGVQGGGDWATVDSAARIFVEEFARCAFGELVGRSGHDSQATAGHGRGDAADGGDASSGPGRAEKVEIYRVDLNDIVSQG